MTDQPLDSHAFRRALGNFATGITIVTAQAPNGDKIGLTVNSFNSVSLDPPLVLWSLDKRSADSLSVIQSADHFAINVLAANQLDLSNHFARPQTDKFANIDYSEGPGRAPLLDACAARFHCALHETIDAGDHWILLGRVLAFDDFGRSPLLYHQGAYSLVLPHPRVEKNLAAQATLPGLEKYLENNLLYLMLQAVNAYQTSYLPKQQALGLSVSEARVLILLSVIPDAGLERLQRESSLPGSEIREAVENLHASGLLESTTAPFSLTADGALRASEYWALSEQEQHKVFDEFNDSQIQLFKKMLNRVIQKA
ncbi:p-hydroxyphenylacetate 3-hydroxylase reductase component [Marinobacterium litorale]|jgi:flavin reductase (DIM6/NTAB) family NADH-FMN oxidoreductase RutF/DNA-binding MarR family transcriptional regulator|uniref:p-hydroxyphenylacetate 3-hydroxylase reductase component n=1 Tax=Marinobacterium litorale TaxID=404770 RepID=UPI000423592F|nr:flavin reductase family protein [Marinobacterium litorale]